MSLILDALKKSEKERQTEPEAQVTPQAPWEVDAKESGPRRLWPWLTVASLARFSHRSISLVQDFGFYEVADERAH